MATLAELQALKGLALGVKIRSLSQNELAKLIGEAIDSKDEKNKLILARLQSTFNSLTKSSNGNGGAGSAAPAAAASMASSSSAAPAPAASVAGVAINSPTIYGIFIPEFIEIIDLHKNAAGIVGEGGSAGGSIVRKITLSDKKTYYVKIINLRSSEDRAKIASEIIISMELTYKIPEYVTKCMGGYVSSKKAYILYEYKDGITLDKVSDQLYREPTKGDVGDAYDKTKILASLKGCVLAMHSIRVVHRDLKPDNVFCCFDSPAPGGRFTHCILIDFGETQRMGEMPKPIVGDGDPIFHNKAIDAKQLSGVTPEVDLFALAKIAVQPLKIRPPDGGNGGLGFIKDELSKDSTIAPFLDTPANANTKAGGGRRSHRRTKIRKQKNKRTKSRKIYGRRR